MHKTFIDASSQKCLEQKFSTYYVYFGDHLSLHAVYSTGSQPVLGLTSRQVKQTLSSFDYGNQQIDWHSAMVSKIFASERYRWPGVDFSKGHCAFFLRSTSKGLLRGPFCALGNPSVNRGRKYHSTAGNTIQRHGLRFA